MNSKECMVGNLVRCEGHGATFKITDMDKPGNRIYIKRIKTYDESEKAHDCFVDGWVSMGETALKPVENKRIFEF